VCCCCCCSVITDLIAEANATKLAIDEVTEGIEGLAVQHPAPPPPAQTNAFEGDLFGFGAPMAAQTQHRSQPVLPSPPRHAPSPSVHSVPEESSYMHSEPVAQTTASVHEQPQSSHDMYSIGHRKTESTASGFGDIMGGVPIPSYTFSTGSTEADVNSYGGGPSSPTEQVPSAEEISELKSKLREAENVSHDAEESRRQLAAQRDELRRVADEAEKNLRAHAKATEGKKKKVFGGGKKKDVVRCAGAFLLVYTRLRTELTYFHDCRKRLRSLLRIPRRRKRLFCSPSRQ
jgi:hypothetical protein